MPTSIATAGSTSCRGNSGYEAPAWAPHRFRELDFRQQYIDCFSDLVVDADADGYPDIVSVSWFAKKVSWWRNPGRTPTTAWTEASIHQGFNVEFAILADVDNDGKALEIVAQENGTGQAWYEVRNGAWVAHVISDRSYGHGIGAGDINGDHRIDILTPRGWLEAPADPRASSWVFHPSWEGLNALPAAAAAASAPAPAGAPRLLELGFMHVADINGDGRNDVVTAAAHDYGVFWFEQGAAAPGPSTSSTTPGRRGTRRRSPISTATAGRTSSPASASWHTTAAIRASASRSASTGTSLGLRRRRRVPRQARCGYGI